jgi:hypothetical protein
MPTTPIVSRMRPRPGAWLCAKYPNVAMRFVDEIGGLCFLQSYDESPCRYGWFALADVWQSEHHTVVTHGGVGTCEPLRYEVKGVPCKTI